MTSALFDPTPIEQIARLEARTGRTGMVNRVVAAFLNDAPAQLERLDQAIRSGQLADVVSTAHAFKGACATLGGLHPAAICGQIESGPADASAHWAELRAAVDAFSDVLRQRTT